MICRFLAALALSALLATTAAADIVYLENGGTLEGKVLSVTEAGVEIQMSYGKITIASERVKRIEKKKSPQEEYVDRSTVLEADDADGHLALARWCRERSLTREARGEYEQVLEFDPENEEARRILGHVRVGEGWMTADEHKRHMRETGHIWEDGRWVSAEEHQAEQDAKAARAEARKLNRMINHYTRIMAESESKAQRARAHQQLLEMADAHELPDLRVAANQAHGFYENMWIDREKHRVTMEVHAQMAGPVEFRRITTTLGGGSSPVTIELPTTRYVSVDSTVSVPAGVAGR